MKLIIDIDENDYEYMKNGYVPHSFNMFYAIKNGTPIPDNATICEWIPISERLPEDGTYLVTVEIVVGEPYIDIKSFAKDLNKVDEFDFPKHKCGWYDYDSEYGYWEDTEVIAWMPLPAPYKAEVGDKE